MSSVKSVVFDFENNKEPQIAQISQISFLLCLSAFICGIDVKRCLVDDDVYIDVYIEVDIDDRHQ